MELWMSDIVYPITRWMHLVCMTLIVGGTLFFELVLPIAIEDMKREERLYVFARARWVFRWVVWVSMGGLVLSGAVTAYRMWPTYRLPEFAIASRWALAHVVIGVVGLAIPLLLTIGRRPPEDPVRWMRLNLVILLVAIFLGSATRHFQLARWEQQIKVEGQGKLPDRAPPVVEENEGAETRPG